MVVLLTVNFIAMVLRYKQTKIITPVVVGLNVRRQQPKGQLGVSRACDPSRLHLCPTCSRHLTPGTQSGLNNCFVVRLADQCHELFE